MQERLVMAMDIVALNLCSRLSFPIIEPQMVWFDEQTIIKGHHSFAMYQLNFHQ